MWEVILLYSEQSLTLPSCHKNDSYSRYNDVTADIPPYNVPIINCDTCPPNLTEYLQLQYYFQFGNHWAIMVHKPYNFQLLYTILSRHYILIPCASIYYGRKLREMYFLLDHRFIFQVWLFWRWRYFLSCRHTPGLNKSIKPGLYVCVVWW